MTEDFNETLQKNIAGKWYDCSVHNVKTGDAVRIVDTEGKQVGKVRTVIDVRPVDACTKQLKLRDLGGLMELKTFASACRG